MKEALLKRRCGIPAALLLALLISIGVASATFVVENMSTSTEITEPIKVRGETDFEATMEPGTSNTWEFKVINNSTSNPYNISYCVTDGLEDESGVSVTVFTIGDTDYLDDLKGTDNVVGQGDNVIDPLDKGFTYDVILEITADNDAPAPQDVDLRINIGREH